nr:MAG TPA: hypothetical protein [Caudoviricetes sp.]
MHLKSLCYCYCFEWTDYDATLNCTSYCIFSICYDSILFT